MASHAFTSFIRPLSSVVFTPPARSLLPSHNPSQFSHSFALRLQSKSIYFAFLRPKFISFHSFLLSAPFFALFFRSLEKHTNPPLNTRKDDDKNGIALLNQITDIQEFICTFFVYCFTIIRYSLFWLSSFHLSLVSFVWVQYFALNSCAFLSFSISICFRVFFVISFRTDCLLSQNLVHDLLLFWLGNHLLKRQFGIGFDDICFVYCIVRVCIPLIPISIWNWSLWNIRWDIMAIPIAFAASDTTLYTPFW